MLTVIIGVVALAGGFAGGFLYRKKVSEKEISSAEEEGRRIVNEAIRNAESKKKEALLEAKEEILKSRTDYEKEEKSRRADLQRQENRLQQKEKGGLSRALLYQPQAFGLHAVALYGCTGLCQAFRAQAKAETPAPAQQAFSRSGYIVKGTQAFMAGGGLGLRAAG